MMDLAKSRAEQERLRQITAWVSEQYQKCKNGRSRVESQWYLNLAFYFGRQNVQRMVTEDVNHGGSITKLFTPPAPPWRARPVINRIKPVVRTELSKLTSQKPNATVIPASGEDSDLLAAQAGEQIWEAFYRQKKIQKILRRSMFWTLTCGNGFVKNYWDESKLDPFTNEVMGDVCITPETPFHILVPDLQEEELEDQPYIIHANVRPLDWVQMRYAQDLEGRPLSMNVKAEDIIESSFVSIIGAQGVKPDSVLCLEVWIKPGAVKMFPEGAMITLIGDQIVEGSNRWPVYQHQQYPFIKFDHIPTGRFYSESIINDLIPLQREFNRTRGQLIEAKNRMAKPQLSAPEGSIRAEAVTTEPGQIIFHKPGFTPPQPIPLQGIPAYVVQECDRILQDISDISGMHEVSNGGVPPGVTAATAITFLQEQDESKLSHTFQSVEEGIEKLAHHILSHVVQYWDVPRTIKVVGVDQSFNAVALKGSDLKGNTDIRIEAGSALPVSKAAKQAFIMDLMKMGFLEPNKGLEVMEIGGIQKIYDQIQVDRRQAQRENLRMQKMAPEQFMQWEQQREQLAQIAQMGEEIPLEELGVEVDPVTGEPLEPPLPVPVNTWDNHVFHIEEHNRFRKTQTFESLSPEIQSLFEMHVNAHVEAIAIGVMSGQPMPGLPMPDEQGMGEENPEGNQFGGLPPAENEEPV